MFDSTTVLHSRMLRGNWHSEATDQLIPAVALDLGCRRSELNMPSTRKVRKWNRWHAHAAVIAAYFFLLFAGMTYAASSATVPISAQLGTSIAGDLFPVTIKLSQGNLFLTDPTLLFLDPQRVGMQLRFQAYDHRPQLGIALSETGSAQLSGALGYDPASRQILLQDPRIDSIQFDKNNEATRRFLADMQAAWTAQVTNPLRSVLPPHPYLVPIRNNIQALSYDGKSITLTLSYE